MKNLNFAAVNSSAALVIAGALTLGQLTAAYAEPTPATLISQPPLPTVALQVETWDGKSPVIRAEAAISNAQKQMGLMGRAALADHAGMVFHFGAPQRQCMWMRNTPVPLTVAFISNEGRILNLADLYPFDETIKCSNGPAAYALEMAQGWFKQHGVADNAQVYGLAELEAMTRRGTVTQ